MCERVREFNDTNEVLQFHTNLPHHKIPKAILFFYTIVVLWTLFGARSDTQQYLLMIYAILKIFVCKFMQFIKMLINVFDVNYFLHFTYF